MKKIVLNLMAISSVCSIGIAYSGTMGPTNLSPSWTGFYVGANVGGWWSQNNSVDMDGAVSFSTPLFLPTSASIANALAAVGTNDLSMNSSGFIGGGQVGYNFEYNPQVVLGVNADIDGLTQSDNKVTVNNVVGIPGFPLESYAATVSVNKNINWLGTVRGRLGYLYNPAFLLYGTGGFAYGGVSLNTSIAATESLGLPGYLPIAAQNKVNSTQIGWTAGGGVEWMFRPHWSASVEYTYYDLGTINNNVALSQITPLTIPPAVVGAAIVNTASRFSVGAIRVGLNYLF